MHPRADLPQGFRANAQTQRNRRFWIALSVLVLAQLVAFWLVCSHQVRKAQMRDVSLEVQRVAVNDCLRFIPHATLNGCLTRVDPDRRPLASSGDKHGAAPGWPAAMSSAAPVNFAYH
jgi:type II secretory pathway component PulL